MSHQFKPGDLALTLVGNDLYPVMTQVELIETLNAGDVWTYKGLKFPLQKAVWVCRSRYWEMIYQAKDLMPLRGNFAPEKQKAKEAA
ncbi:hypothetical protein [Pseudomonas amygdali]|uniref:hypothetical protein n=1 Tax=Pseudomonas amygdali TaxID=47877 RepID=UPI0009AF50F3|nr:hypothetical protein [Pseudomonas amygdali]ARA80239.1 hypothetical protein B5U27_09315 [Pseudomonas amygdali pv. lachrymans]